MNIYLVIDESGSMSPLRDDTIGGFNSFVAEQQKFSKENSHLEPAYLFVTCFDTIEIRKPIWGALVEDVKPWTTNDYHPRGGTPLLDAVGEVLDQIKPNENGIVVIITDGYENSSHKYSRAQIKAAIETKQGAGWKIVYLGANVDAFAEGGSLGVRSASTSGYRHDTVGTRSAYAAGGQSVTMTRSGIDFAVTQDSAGNPVVVPEPEKEKTPSK